MENENRLINSYIKIDHWIDIANILTNYDGLDKFMRIHTYLAAHNIVPIVTDIDKLVDSINPELQGRINVICSLIKQRGIQNVKFVNCFPSEMCVTELGTHKRYESKDNFEQNLMYYNKSCYTDGTYEECVQDGYNVMYNIKDAKYIIVEYRNLNTNEIIKSDMILSSFDISLPIAKSKNKLLIYKANSEVFDE